MAASRDAKEREIGGEEDRVEGQENHFPSLAGTIEPVARLSTNEICIGFEAVASGC